MNARQRLAELVAIPGVSAKAFPPSEVRRSAAAVAETLIECGLRNVRLLDHDAVCGERIVHRDAPTVLVYGHHDVQPPGREERWLSPPFEAVIRDGRMYGRGTSDDKGGFLAYLAAIERDCPCNVKLLIEGEEEIGSPNLGALLDAHRELLRCDYAVLCDTPNFDTGVPALTYRLRGNCLVDVEVRCLERPVHSGQGGGLVPDAIQILCRMLAKLQDGVPGLDERVQVDESQLAAMRALPFKHDFPLLDGVPLRADSWEHVWARPSITVTAIEAVPIANAANQIADSARARISLRTVKNLGTREAGELLAKALMSPLPAGGERDRVRGDSFEHEQPLTLTLSPHGRGEGTANGAQVNVTIHGGPSWWEADPAHPLFTAARRALTRGFGREAVMMGSGGSIGFVKPFADLLPDVPLLLTGVQDPHSNAHSENESLHLGDYEKAIDAATYLFEELRCFPRPT